MSLFLTLAKSKGVAATRCSECGHSKSCCGGHKKKRTLTIDELLKLLE